MVTPSMALAYAVVDPGWTLRAIHPGAAIGVAGLAGWYLWRARQGAAATPSPAGAPASGQHGAPPARATPSVRQRIAFAAGLLALLAALSGPLRDLGDRFLMSAHALQFLLISLVAAPLLVLGTPGWMLRPLLARPPVASVARVLARPAMCFALFNVSLIAWHLPALHNAALANPAVHAVQHVMFVGAALLVWWPLLSPLPELPRLSYPAQMLYCFAMSLPLAIVAMSIVNAPSLLYPAYSLAPRLWGITPMTDQYVTGLLLGVLGGMFFYGVLSVVFFRWAQLQSDDASGAETGARR